MVLIPARRPLFALCSFIFNLPSPPRLTATPPKRRGRVFGVTTKKGCLREAQATLNNYLRVILLQKVRL